RGHRRPQRAEGMNNQALSLLILLFPTAGALLLAGRGWRLPRVFTVIIGPGVVWASFAATLALFFGKASGDFTYWTWIKSGSFERNSAVVAARKAFVMNVIGDVGMILGTFVVFVTFHATTYAGVFDQLKSGTFCGRPTNQCTYIFVNDSSMLELAAFLFLVGA